MKKVMVLLFGLCFTWILMTKVDVSYAATNYVEIEDNGSIDDATEIDCGSEVKGNISEEYDLDYYKFAISAPGNVSITFQHENLMDTDRFWIIRIFDEQTNELVCLESHGTETTSTSTEVGLPSGNFYVKVNSSYNDHRDYYDFSSYSFIINYESSDLWESELNNSYSSATPIQVNTKYSGANQFYNDKDYYEFYISEAGKVSIEFQHTNLMSDGRYWIVKIYNVKTENLVYLDSYGIDMDKTSAEVGLPEGTYYVLIDSEDGASNGWGGNYSSSTYQFVINYEPNNLWELEANDEYDYATPIVENTTYYGANQDEDDKDYYKFILLKDQYITVSFSHPNIGVADTYWIVKIIDAKTNERMSIESQGIDSKIQSERIYLPEGIYYLKITSDACDSWYRENHSFETYSFCILTGNSHTDNMTSDDNTNSGTQPNAGTGNNSNSSSKSSLAKVKKLKVKAKKKAASLTWTTVINASEYQIQYATNKKFTKKKTMTSMFESKTIRKLKAKKTYYFRVRAYKWENGEKVYGKWSNVAKAKIKK